MPTLNGFSSAEITYDENGGLVGTDQDVLTLAGDPSLTDLLVLAHGWHDDVTAARAKYAALTQSMRGVLTAGQVPALANRAIGIVGLLWPAGTGSSFLLVPAGVGDARSAVTERSVLDGIDRLRAVFPGRGDRKNLAAAAELVPDLDRRPTAQDEFVEQVRSLTRRDSTDSTDSADAGDDIPVLNVQRGRDLIEQLANPLPIPAPGARPPAGAYLTVPGGTFGAAFSLLGLTDYHTVRARAGVVGALGLAPTLGTIRTNRPTLRLHLAGHSFGARLVTSAANTLPTGPPDPLATVTLLQAAFSHFAFADSYPNPNVPGPQVGSFRPVVTGNRLGGPMLITYTDNDLVLRLAYAFAAGYYHDIGDIARTDLIHDPNDPWAALGHDGALNTPEAVPGTLLDAGGAYTWQAGRPHNLLADAHIANHGDVTNPAVAYAMLSAIATT